MMVKPLEGLSEKSLLFVNSSEKVLLNPPLHIVRTLNEDLTALALRFLGRDVLSSALGAVACKLSGVISHTSMERAVFEELSELGLEKDALEKNVSLAKECYKRIPDVNVEYESKDPEYQIVEISYAGAHGIPDVISIANTASRKTGSWRIFKPILNKDLCTACGMCYIYCPEECIDLDEDGKPSIDYDNCKGCLICLQECPRKAISSESVVA